MSQAIRYYPSRNSVQFFSAYFHFYYHCTMADVYSKAKRSYTMSRIRSKDTKPEILVRKYLFAEGFRFRLHNKKIPGSPDISLKKHKCLIFVNGCFWHGHSNCKISHMPKTNKKFWNTKIWNNIKRDKRTLKKLRKLGWKVLVIWECQIKGEKTEINLQKLIRNILPIK
jgi:DNA mismatch endonuclease, patch repair protein